MRFEYDESLFPQIQNRIEFDEKDLADLQALKEVIMQADKDYPFGHTPSIQATYFEGKEIVNRFQMSQSYPP